MAQTILVTGSTSGFGRLTVETLARQGYRVFAGMRAAAGKNASAAEELRALAQREQLALHLVEIDVTDDASVEQAIAVIIETTGRLDVVVNNAGVSYSGPLEAFTLEQVRQQFETNVFGVLRVNRAVLPQMVEALACLRASGLSLDEVNHFNTILSTHTAPTPTTIATSTFFVRSATSADASAASVSARLLASTVGAIIATSTAPGICRSHASMRGEGVTRPISQKPPARVAYVTSRHTQDSNQRECIIVHRLSLQPHYLQYPPAGCTTCPAASAPPLLPRPLPPPTVRNSISLSTYQPAKL